MTSSHRLMTIKEAFNYFVNSYPSLYASNTLDEAKLKVYDQIFNTIGNGINDINDFHQYFLITENTDESLLSKPSTKYMNGETLYRCFTRVNEEMSTTLEKECPDFDSLLQDLLTLEEIKTRPEIKIYRKANKFNFNPYPNFKEEYSLLYYKDISLPNDWLTEIKWFYEKCKEFFLSDRVHDYHYFYPRDNEEKKWKSLYKGYSERFQEYEKDSDNMKEAYQKISDAYSIPYDGDINVFIKKKGDKELKRVLSYIENSIQKIDSMM